MAHSVEEQTCWLFVQYDAKQAIINPTGVGKTMFDLGIQLVAFGKGLVGAISMNQLSAETAYLPIYLDGSAWGITTAEAAAGGPQIVLTKTPL
jgi:hypothetical protein